MLKRILEEKLAERKLQRSAEDLSYMHKRVLISAYMRKIPEARERTIDKG